MINLRLILRTLWKRRFTNSINLIGIIIGLTACVLLLSYVKNEYAANNYLPGFNETYRLQTNWSEHVNYRQIELIKRHIPEISELTIYQFSWSWKDFISYNNKDYGIEKAVYADSSFFKVFQFPVLYGNLETALNSKSSLVLTQCESERIFGNQNSVGEEIWLNTTNFGKTKYTVKAVIQNFPPNSSFDFQAVLTLQNLMDIEWYKSNAQQRWGSYNYSSFVKINSQSDFKLIGKKIDELIINNAPDWVQDALPYKFNPLAGLHLNAKESDGVFIPNKKSTVIILGSLGLLVLVLAGINYFNLSITQLASRNSDIGIKKTIGASSRNIGMQSMLSTLILFLIASIFTVLLIYAILPVFNNLTGSTFNFASFFNIKNLLFLFGILILSTFLFGVFPALFAVNKVPLSVLAKNGSTLQNAWTKNGLVVFQFFIAIVLISSTIMLNKQNHFLLKSNYGYNSNNIMYIPLSPEVKDKKKIFEERLEKEYLVHEVAFGSGLFGEIDDSWGRNLYGVGEPQEVEFDMTWVSKDFFDVFDLQITDGIGFTENSSKNNDVIFNEKFVEKYKLKEPLSSSLSENGGIYQTKGIVKDFNHATLHNKITPFAFICRDDRADIAFVKYASLSPMQTKELLAKAENIWSDISPDFPFEAHFLDKHYELVYKKELKMMKVLMISSILSILIAVSGLFCIVLFTINKRMLEIGIRKVNGAKIIEVMHLLNKDFIVWVFIAIILATPVTYLILNKWLQNFAFKAQLSWWIFIVSGFGALLIALLTVSWQTFRAARRNPVEALRYE